MVRSLPREPGDILKMGLEKTMASQRPLPNLGAHARWLYPLVVVALASILGHFYGLGLSLLIVAGGTLGGSIWLLWSSLQGLGGDLPITLDEALSLGAPSAEEEQKRAVLRALKDLEYERAVGKINDDDYATLAQHYRGEAKRLLRVVDQDLSPERERAERILSERLAATPGATRAAPARTADDGAKKGDARKAPASEQDDRDEPKDGRDAISNEDAPLSERTAAKSPSSGTLV
jgi:hypothetical protein